VIDYDYLNDKQNKIEFVKCPKKEMKCKEQLTVINKIYIDTEFYRREKDYKSSIETLKNAFYITTELTEKPCTKCAEVFRATVIDSLENIHSELKNITTGIFGNKKYQSSLTLSQNALNELKSYNLRDTLNLNNSSESCIENNTKNEIS
jgi:hypothetical protein